MRWKRKEGMFGKIGLLQLLMLWNKSSKKFYLIIHATISITKALLNDSIANCQTIASSFLIGCCKMSAGHDSNVGVFQELGEVYLWKMIVIYHYDFIHKVQSEINSKIQFKTVSGKTQVASEHWVWSRLVWSDSTRYALSPCHHHWSQMELRLVHSN